MGRNVSNARTGVLARLTQRQQHRQKSVLDCTVSSPNQPYESPYSPLPANHKRLNTQSSTPYLDP